MEARLENPIMPLRILRIRTLTNSSIIRGFLATGLYATSFLGALYLENVLGYSPIRTGLAFLPFSVMMGLLSAGATAHRIGGRPVGRSAPLHRQVRCALRRRRLGLGDRQCLHAGVGRPRSRRTRTIATDHSASLVAAAHSLPDAPVGATTWPS